MAIVSFDYGELPPMTEEYMMEPYIKVPDEEIDTSDIPPITEETAAKMVQGDEAMILWRKRRQERKTRQLQDQIPAHS
jgi:hypothetical protein